MEYIAELGTTAVVVWQAKHLYHAIRAHRIFKWSNKYPALNFIYTNSNETYNCVLFVPRAETVAAPWYSTEQASGSLSRPFLQTSNREHNTKESTFCTNNGNISIEANNKHTTRKSVRKKQWLEET